MAYGTILPMKVPSTTKPLPTAKLIRRLEAELIATVGKPWEPASVAGVSRDLMMLAETATLPYMLPSSVLRTNGGYVQINIAGWLTRLAEWAAL
jgi:hypothetical protein